MKAKSPLVRSKRTELPVSVSPVDRRRFLGQLGVGAASIAALTASTAKAAPVPPGKNVGASAGYQSFRQARAYEVRMAAAQMARDRPFVAHSSNGDETLYANRIGNFSKGLPHNSLGEVDAAAYGAFMGAIASGTMADFDRIPMGGTVKFTNPLAGLAFDLEGPDSHHLTQPPAPTIASGEGGADLGENYWLALSRDVPFVDWGTSPAIADAAADLSRFPEFRGPKAQGRVTPDTIFRGNTAGDLVGPYLSQFLWMDIPMGALRVDQRIWTMPQGRDFLTTYDDWLAVQNGLAVSPHPPDTTARYIRNLRDLGEWVHVDALYQAYHQACLILLGARAPFSVGMPYAESATQFGFGTFGGPHILSLVTEVATRALKVVWYQKWYVHRRVRPEAFAGLVHNTRRGAASYPVSRDILNSSAPDAVWSPLRELPSPDGRARGLPHASVLRRRPRDGRGRLRHDPEGVVRRLPRSLTARRRGCRGNVPSRLPGSAADRRERARQARGQRRNRPQRPRRPLSLGLLAVAPARRAHRGQHPRGAARHVPRALRVFVPWVRRPDDHGLALFPLSPPGRGSG